MKPMSDHEELKATLRQKANAILGRLSPSEREALLIKCWMSHDARWFMAVAGEYGIQITNRLNQIAAHEIGKVEAQRVARALQLAPVATLGDYLLAQEIFIGLLGPDLLDYSVIKVGDHAFQVHVQRCFAYEHAVRAGIAGDYECGIFARITGWLDALDLAYKTNPSLGKCLKARGWECIYTVTLLDKSG